jgi:hypothetical protein
MRRALAHCARRSAALLPVLFLLCAGGPNLRAAQQGGANTYDRVSEVVATLASGQVAIFAAHDGLVVAAVGNEFEPEDLPPLIVPLGENDFAVVLGAADWIEPPPHQRTLLRLDQQLPSLVQGYAGNAPHLRSGANIANLEKVAMAVLDPLRRAARSLHAQIEWPSNLPLVELLLVHQPEGAAPTVWDLTYWMHQTFLEENFWNTEIDRPRATELYPAENNHADAVDVRYPPANRSPGIFDWIEHPTGRLLQDIQTDPKLAKAQKQIAAGNAHKVHLAEMVPLVKATLETMAPASKIKVMAEVDSKQGFTWVLAPPPETRPKRPAGAPTLLPTPH